MIISAFNDYDAFSGYGVRWVDGPSFVFNSATYSQSTTTSGSGYKYIFWNTPGAFVMPNALSVQIAVTNFSWNSGTIRKNGGEFGALFTMRFNLFRVNTYSTGTTEDSPYDPDMLDCTLDYEYSTMSDTDVNLSTITPTISNKSLTTGIIDHVSDDGSSITRKADGSQDSNAKQKWYTTGNTYYMQVYSFIHKGNHCSVLTNASCSATVKLKYILV